MARKPRKPKPDPVTKVTPQPLLEFGPSDFSSIEEFVAKHPVLAVVGLVVTGMLLMQPSRRGQDVPGLYERRNGAWRGKGSFGHAPFGKQSSHRR